MTVAMGDFIQRYPLLRLFFFYAVGIALADVCFPHAGQLMSYAGWGVLLLLTLSLLCVGRRGVCYGVMASLLFVLLGIWGYSQARSGYIWSSREECYEARVLTEPRARRQSLLCEMEVLAVQDSMAWQYVGHKVMAYMESSDAADGLMPGDRIFFKSRVRVPSNFSDSLSFDYTRYVALQGASGIVYLSSDDWHRVGEGALTLRDRMLHLRHLLLDKYAYASFDADVVGVLSALTLGDRRGLSDEVRAAYRDAGAAHMLALSGLHVGIIYGVLVVVLGALLRRRSLRWLCELLTLVALWCFALMVGLSASVVRAVAMCTLYVFARWVSADQGSPLHVLSLTALVMLLFRPLYLFDVGFQLSFVAMDSILCLYPYLKVLFGRYAHYPGLGYFVGLLCVSVAAQLGTLPLVLHYFGAFPTYFLVTNLLVVPCLVVVLIVSLLWWALLLMGLPGVSLLSWLLQYLVGWINDALGCIGQWPGAVLRVGDYDGWAVLFTYILFLSAGLLIAYKENEERSS